MGGLTSAAGVVGYLSESDPAIQAFALERLNEHIESVWTEVSGSIGIMYVHLILRSEYFDACHAAESSLHRVCLFVRQVGSGDARSDGD